MFYVLGETGVHAGLVAIYSLPTAPLPRGSSSSIGKSI